MDKQELIDKAVEAWEGIFKPEYDYVTMFSGDIYNATTNRYSDWIFNIHEFQQRARELGWINGYRYGEEYQTNGKKPDLPDDLVIKRGFSGNWPVNGGLVSAFTDWSSVTEFRIVDEHYKPVEQSQAAVSYSDSNLNEFAGYAPVDSGEVVYVTGKKDLSDASFALSEAINALTDCGEIAAAHKLQEINRGILAKQKAQLADIERKRVVDAALSAGITVKPQSKRDIMERLYDKGFLKLPDQP